MGRTLLAAWFSFVALFGPQLCCCAPAPAAVAAEHAAEPECRHCCVDAPPCCETPAAPQSPADPESCPCEKARATLADMAPVAPPLDWDDTLSLPDAPALADAQGWLAVGDAPTPPADGPPPRAGRTLLALLSVLRC